jgi:hypothetical protein
VSILSTSARETLSKRRRDRESRIRTERNKTARKNKTAKEDRTDREDKIIEIAEDKTIETNTNDIDEIESVRFDINEDES